MRVVQHAALNSSFTRHDIAVTVVTCMEYTLLYARCYIYTMTRGMLVHNRR
jgi:hypothetical protein